VFDHTSIIRFMERVTGVMEPNISACRRQLCGDLTSAFDFTNVNTNYPSLTAATSVNCGSGTTPRVPKNQTMPSQESGTMLARPLPYQPDATSYTDCAAGRFHITMTNGGSASVHFAIYANNYRGDGPWQYDVGPSNSVDDFFSVVTYGGGFYDLTCYGPNGFQRRFAGNINTNCNQLEVTSSIDASAGSIALTMRNSTASAATFTITNGYPGTGGPWTYNVPANSTATNIYLATATNSGWYHLTATINGTATFLRRAAGHIEPAAGGGMMMPVANLTDTAEPPAIVISPAILSNGHFQVSLTAVPGTAYTLLCAPTVNGPWTSLTNLEADLDGLWKYEDITASPPSARFYRISQP